MLIDLTALFWVGVWQAMVAKNPHRATSTSLARILVLPWVVIALLSLFISLGALSMRIAPGTGFFMGMWFVVGVATDLLFGVQARRKILTEFRLAASHRYATRPSFWKRLWRPDATSGAGGFPPAVVIQK